FCDFLRGLARLCEAELTALADLAPPLSTPRRRDSVVTLSSGADATEDGQVEPVLSEDVPLERTG
ncbi:MAG TPA: hypothetical protein VHO25_06865, partial [Polyangiaceae bacterium]|nr:hypothetical protein [Polyangiaceae bacterium]